MKHKHNYELIEKFDNFAIVKLCPELKPKLFYQFYCKECLKFEMKVLEK